MDLGTRDKIEQSRLGNADQGTPAENRGQLETRTEWKEISILTKTNLKHNLLMI